MSSKKSILFKVLGALVLLVVVLLVLAVVFADSIIKASQLGVEDYIRKPFVPEDLISRVSKAVWEHWQEESLDTLGSSLDDLLKDFGQD